MTLLVETFHDAATGSVTYAIADLGARVCAVIDPVLDFDPATWTTSTRSLRRVCAFLDRRELRLDWILETHVHADHLSGAATLRDLRGGRLGTGAGIEEVRRRWRQVAPDRPREEPFDRLFSDGDRIALGAFELRVMETPGHTPGSVSYLVEGCVFVGDTLFMPEAGTARCDFPGGDARELYRSIQRLFALPGHTRVFTGHDYGHERGGEARSESRISTQRRENVHVGNAHLGNSVSEETFVRLRTDRDRTLPPPVLMFPAVQANLYAGQLPARELRASLTSSCC